MHRVLMKNCIVITISWKIHLCEKSLQDVLTYLQS